MILDVGSAKPSKDFLYLKGENVIHIDIDRTAKINVLCDAHVLPFKDDSFNIVHASHVLEHLSNPLEALREWYRVSKKWVVIKVPNRERFVHDAEVPFTRDHLFSWSKYTLTYLLERAGFRDVETFDTDRRLPNVWFCFTYRLHVILERLLFGSDEITAYCRVDK
jgi:SAM-dependent methyltransferase